MSARFAKLRPLAAVAKALPLVALLACLYLLAGRLEHFELAQIGAALGQLSPWQWTAASLLTGVSFAAIGQYDAVIHRVLGTGVSPRRARFAGMRAIALSQTVGFSSLSGGVVRLRCLPELDLWTITRLTLLVSLSFLGAWAVLAGSVLLLGHGGPAGLIVVLLVVIIGCVARFRPDTAFPGLSPRTGVALLIWTAIDTSCAALVLGVLIPPDLMPGFHALFAAYLLALGAGLLSQSPAGLGAFELTLLLLLPQIPQGPLLAAVLAYRVIYFLCPAMIALILLIRPARIPAPADLHTAFGSARLRALARAPRAEWGLAHQGAEIVLARDQAAGWLVRQTGGCLVTLGRPLGPPDLPGLADLAGRRGLGPILYKCDGHTAAVARAAGWRVARISQDAVINLTHWSLTDPTCRQLRRKLRDATKASLRIETHPKLLPLAEMAFVAQEWATRNHGEKGFSMGQFDLALLRHQQVVLGYVGDRLVGFASFHIGRQDWALDLMRQGLDAPGGTMHALVHAGLTAAAQAGVAQVSLAAVPRLPGRWVGLTDWFPGVAGLRQFKRSFGPIWRPLYLCAPTLPGMVRAALQVTTAVHWPQRAAPHRAHSAIAGQDHHAYFEFETGTQACDARRMISNRAADAIPVPRRPRTGRANVERPFPPP